MMRNRTTARLALGAIVALTTIGVSAASASAALQPVASYGVGLPSSGNGAMITPFGTSVAPDGTVVVADVSNQRVDVFAQDGTFLRAFGTDVAIGGSTGPESCVTNCQAGSPGGGGAGDVNTPYGVVAGAGEIYVSEVGNLRVSAYDYEGHFLRAFGTDVGGPGVNLCTATCFPGKANFESGGMAAPSGLALDASGNIFVGDLGLARISVYVAQTGLFIRAFGKDVGGPGVNSCTTACSPGTNDGSPGSIGPHFGIALAGGEVYVAEISNNRISVFGEDGTFRRTFGTMGEGAGQLGSPYGVAVDPATANAYVAEAANQRLSNWGVAGDFRSASGFDVIPGEPLGVETCTAVCKAGGAEYGVGGFVSPFSAASDCRGAIYVGMIGKVVKYADPSLRKPPCPSNAFTIGKVKKNKKKGTATVTVTLPGPGTLTASLNKKLSAKVPQPQGAGVVKVTVKAAGKGVKALKKKGKLKGNLKLTFTPPNGDPATQSKKLTLAKKMKKSKKAKKSGR